MEDTLLVSVTVAAPALSEQGGMESTDTPDFFYEDGDEIGRAHV